MANEIDLSTAVDYTTAWRNALPQGDFNIKAWLISSDIFTSIISDSNPPNIRAYIGVDGDGEYKLVIVGVDDSGNDILYSSSGDSAIYDFTQPCPNTCDTDSPLN